MAYAVSYHCPRCGAIVELSREGYLADKAVTPYPFEGWEYAAADAGVEAVEDADGVRFVCGDDGTLREGETGCGEPFYLSFVRFEDGEEVDPRRPSERVEIDLGGGPAGPSGPRGPSGRSDPPGR